MRTARIGALGAVLLVASSAGALAAPSPAALTTPAQGRAEVQAGLEALVTTIDPVRAGGVGTALVHVVHRAEPGLPARDVVLRVTAGAGITIRAAVGPRWSCATDAAGARCTRARMDPGTPTAPIRVTLAGSAGIPDATRALTASLSWKEHAAARMPGRGRARVHGNATRGLSTYTDVTRGQVETDPRLGVKVSTTGPAMALARDGDATHLRADISGIVDTAASIDWRQACTTTAEAARDRRCGGTVAPRARLLSPAHRDDAHAIEVLAVEMPVTDRPANLVFEATVREGGSVATGRATVISRPVVTPEYDPRIDTLEELRNPAPAPEVPMVAAATPVVRGGVGGAGPTTVVAGRASTITARVPGRQVVRTTWRVVGDGREILRGAVQAGTSIRVTPSPRLVGRVITLVATAALEGGSSVELAEIILVTSPTRAGPRASASKALLERTRSTAAGVDRIGRKLQAARATDSRGPDGTACDLADKVRRGQVQPVPSDPRPDVLGYPSVLPDTAPDPDIAMGDTGLLWLGRATATQDAGKCTVTFESGELHYGSYAFVNVSGKITSDGLRLLGGAFNPPESWLEKSGSLREAVRKAVNDTLAFSLPEDSAVRLGASIASDGGWGDLSGQLTIDAGLSLLPLPNDWRFLPAKLELDAQGVMSVTITAAAPAGQSGSVAITGSAGGSGSTELDVEAAGLVLMHQVVTDPDTGAAVIDTETRKPATSQVTANFGGDFTFTYVDNPAGPRDGSPKLELAVGVRGSLENLVLASNFTVERIGFEWTPSNISADARVRVGRGPQPTAVLAGQGNYRGSDDWSVGISTQLAWQVTKQLKIDSLEGTMERKAGRTTITARGAASGWPAASAFEFDSITAELTNACPVPAVPGRECKDATAHIELDAKGRVALPQFNTDADEKMPWNASASIDLQTRIFTLTGGLSSASGIGPAELKLTGISLQLSNDTTKQWCTQPGTDGSAKGDVRMGIAATGEVFGKQVEFAGEFGGKAGLCLIGRMGTMPSDVPSASLFREVEVAYTSQQVIVNLPGGGPRLSAKRQVSVFADFTLPSGVERAASGEYYLLGTLGLADRSIVASVGVEYPSDARKIIAGSASGSHLALSGLSFSFIWSRTELAAAATAKLDYETPANPGKGIGASSTPLAGTLAFDLRRATFSISAYVDSQRAPGGEVSNAFGVQDLLVRQLGISGSVGGNTSIAFSADVTLPTRWVGAIGVRSGTQEVLDFSISETEPCMRVAIRRPAGDATGVAVDLANLGLVTAHEVGLTLAPLGCRLPGNQVVEPGFAFVFDGYLAGLFKVNINSRVELPTYERPTHLAVFTHAEIGAFSLGSVAKFDETVLDIDIDTTASRYKVGFKGGLDIIGNTVSMSVLLEKGAGLGDVTFKSKANADLNVVGFAFKGEEALDFAVTGGKLQTFRIHALLKFSVLGVNALSARVDFDYDDGVVQKWGFEIGLGVPLIIASAQGHVSFDYALHKAAGRDGPKDPFTRKTFDIGFGGKLRFLFWSTSFQWSVFHYEGALTGTGREGVNDTIEETQKEPEPPALPQVGWDWMKGDGWTSRTAVSAVTYKVRYSTTSTGADAPRMLVRGGIDINTCEVVEFTGKCAPGRDESKDPKFVADIDFLKKTITVQDAQADCTAPMRGYCRDWRDVVLSGDDWRAMVRWIEAARQSYAEDPENAGKVLPPLKHWTVSQVPVALGWADFGDSRSALRWGFTQGLTSSPRSAKEVLAPYGSFGNTVGVAMANGKTGLARLNESPVLPDDGAPARAVPVVGDWDGDGYDGMAVWHGRSSRNAGATIGGLWIKRHDGGTIEALDDPTACPAYCQPVPAPGTKAYMLLDNADRWGMRGAAFPVAGDWDAYEQDGSAADTIGLATFDRGTMNWVLRPAKGNPIKVTFGTSTFGRQPVPQAISGDWNGDGTTDIGVYDPPGSVGQTGRFRLLTSRSYPKDPSTEAAPDITIAMGHYGEQPVTGDWNGDQITDIGLVDARLVGGGPTSWRLRFVRSDSCSADCAPDVTVSTAGSRDIVPVSGHWR